MEKTKKLLPKELKKVFLVDIISYLSNGLNPSQIAIKLNCSEQRINYHIKTLKDKGLIKKVGYGTWEITKNLVAVTNEVRGHAFTWKIKLNKNFDWSKILLNSNMEFKLISSNKAVRIIINNQKIWLNKQSIIIYDKSSYFSPEALESRRQAVYSMIQTCNQIMNKLKIKFDISEFTVSRQHYSLIKNNLAIQCNKEGKRINIYNEKGLWFIIDNSYNLHEAETIHPETALIDNKGLQNYLNSHKETNWKVTPMFLMESLSRLTNIQIETNKQLLEYKAQNKSHLALINQYRQENKAWRNNFIKENKIIIKDKKQKSLFDFN
jgi:hypothetical protein